VPVSARGVRTARARSSGCARLPENLRFSLESADRGEADEVGEVRGAVPYGAGLEGAVARAAQATQGPQGGSE